MKIKEKLKPYKKTENLYPISEWRDFYFIFMKYKFKLALYKI